MKGTIRCRLKQCVMQPPNKRVSFVFLEELRVQGLDVRLCFIHVRFFLGTVRGLSMKNERLSFFLLLLMDSATTFIPFRSIPREDFITKPLSYTCNLKTGSLL